VGFNSEKKVKTLSRKHQAFLKQFQAKLVKMNEKQGSAARKLIVSCLNRLVVGSPVVTGRYRSGHFVVKGTPLTTTVKPDAIPIVSPNVVIARGEAVLNSIDFAGAKGLKVYLTNPLVYARPIEHGSSIQKPKGVYSVVAVWAERKWANITKEKS